MSGKRRRDERDDPGLYDPEDELAIHAGLEKQPVGPEWWEGRWPEGGINSLEDLGKWVDDRLNEMIWLHRTGSLRKIARLGGQQTIKNATRYLDRHARGDHPHHPPPEQLERLDQIEAALGALLRYLRREDSSRSPVVPTPATSQVPPEPPLDPDQEEAARANRPEIDESRFIMRWKGKSYQFKNTKMFWVMVYLVRRFGELVPVNDLIDEVWEDSRTEPNTVQRTISNLRRYLASLDITDLSIDGSNQGHYRLHEP